MVWMLVMLALTLVESSFADPRQWDIDGVPVRTANNIQNTGQTVRADDGALMTVWARSDREYARLFGQLLSPQGERMWELNGRLLVYGGNRGVDYPQIVFTGDGYLAVWMKLDINNLSEEIVLLGDIMAMKYDLNGSALWDDPELDGVLVQDGGNGSFQPDLVVCEDGNGGAFVHWWTQGHWYLQRLTDSGDIAWVAPVELPTSNYWSQYSLVSDGLGNVFVRWNHQSAIRLQKYSGDGLPQWTEPVTITQQSFLYSQVANLISDGTGGVMTCWHDNRHQSSEAIYAQRVNGNGQVMWQEGGEQVRLTDEIIHFRVCESRSAEGVDGIIVTWKEADYPRVERVEKMSIDGTALWGGNPVCNPASPNAYQSGSRAISDFAGGALVSWTEGDFATPDTAKMARVNATGETVWESCAVRLGTGGSLQPISLALGEPSRIVALWFDYPGSAGFQWTTTVNIETGETLTDPQALDDLLSGDANYVSQMQLSQGRTVLVWADTRSYLDGYTIYYNILEADGSSTFPRDGSVLVSAQASPSWSPSSLCTDQSGGFFYAFQTISQGVRLNYITRRTWDNIRIGPENGQLIEPATQDQDAAALAPDGAGGTFAAWEGYDENFQLDIWVQRMDAQCMPVWNDPLHLTTNSMEDETVIGVAPSWDNSAIITFRTGQWEEYVIHAARVAPNGDVLWDHVVAPAGRLSDHVAISDERGGVVMGWTRYDSEMSREELWLQRLNAQGIFEWSDEGLPLDTTSDWVTQLSLAVDSDLNVYAAYIRASQSQNDRVTAHKVSEQGEKMWTDSGYTVIEADGITSDVTITATNRNNIYVSWAAWHVGTQSGRVMHLDGQAEIAPDPFWSDPDGGRLCELQSYQSNVQVTPDGLGGLVASWYETSHSEAIWGLAAQRIFDPIPLDAREEHTLPTKFSLAQNYPNPFNPETVIEFALPQAVRTTLRVYDLLGREVATLVDAPMEAGAHRVNFDGSVLSSGVYFYRIEAGDFEAVRKMVLMK